ncbi:MAG: (2Fe-2S)-binding protein [Eubacteriales bacterium]|jgi:carbon-monoxide dehydrogenase small subunit
MIVTLTLNGKKIVDDIAPDEMLLDFVRRHGCYSVKRGCDTTNCGLCTIWVDEKPVLSCSYLAARAEGRSVTTLEGVQEEAKALGECMASEGAEQCGFCSPGFIMAALAMRRELHNPTEAEINEYLKGNLCRCTGYMSHMRAIKKWMEVR